VWQDYFLVVEPNSEWQAEWFSLIRRLHGIGGDPQGKE
jgi:hypothetical protein